MDSLRDKLRASAIHARVGPFVVFVALLFFQAFFPASARFWMYLVRTLVGAWCVYAVWDMVPEIRWAISWEAVVVGVAVFVMWVGIDPYYPKFEALFKKEPWNPVEYYGEGSFLAFFFIAVRTLGSAIVVPPIEEAFFRSFLYRYMVKKNFVEMSFSRLHWLSLIVTSAVFASIHYEWLAGFLCGLAYQALVIRKNRVGDAMTAHAITNFLLGIYIPWRDAWEFW